MTDTREMNGWSPTSAPDAVEIPLCRVGGLPIARLTRAKTADMTIRLAIARRGLGLPCLIFTTANGQGISYCATSSDTRALFQAVDVISADGMSVVFASRLFYRDALPERVATTDAFHDAARVAEESDATFYILGAEAGANARAISRAREIYPRLRIVGSRHGYFSREEEHGIIDDINKAAPDVLWVGLGVPAQQAFLVRNRHLLTHVGVAKTCGGLFDFLSGDVPRAPRWMQSVGFEWLFRTLHDPRRLFGRYFVTNPHAAYVMLTQSGGELPPIVIRPARSAGLQRK